MREGGEHARSAGDVGDGDAVVFGGADGRTPELRPLPFRGMMRYWFRALAGQGRALALPEV